MRVRFGVYLDQDLLNRLQEIARRNREGVSTLVERVIREHVGRSIDESLVATIEVHRAQAVTEESEPVKDDAHRTSHRFITITKNSNDDPVYKVRIEGFDPDEGRVTAMTVGELYTLREAIASRNDLAKFMYGIELTDLD